MDDCLSIHLSLWLSHLCPPFKPSVGYRQGAIWQVHLWDASAKTCSVAIPPVLCGHLANTHEKLGALATVIPLFTKLLWCPFLIGTVDEASIQYDMQWSSKGFSSSNEDQCKLI